MYKLMEIKGIITGDIVKSTSVQPERRPALLGAVQRLTDELGQLSPLKMEMFRGDSFQIQVEAPAQALKVAVLFRAGLKSMTPPDADELWDARVAIGVGTVSYEGERVSVSDGEAFQYSGRRLDEIGKRRLSIRTRWAGVDDELEVSTAFADDILTGWSRPQARAVYLSLLYGLSQKEIAARLEKTSQSVSKLLAAARENLIKAYLDRYQQLIAENEAK